MLCLLAYNASDMRADRTGRSHSGDVAPPSELPPDRPAFRLDELYRTHRALIVWKAFQITDDRDLAEDIAQDVFVKILRAPPQWRGADRMRAYLCVAAKNQARNVMRDVSRRRKITRALHEAGLFRHRSSLDSPAAYFEVRTILGRTLRAMPRAVRSAFVVRVLHGVPTKTAAAERGIAQQTLRNQVRSARAVLRRAFVARGWLIS